MGDFCAETNEDSLDNTISLSQDGGTFLRTKPLQDDIDAGYFDVLLQPGKRTEKNRGLKYEKFDFNIYVINQSGFLTDRPLFWTKQIEKYVSSAANVSSVVHYKWMKNVEKYHSYIINIAYQITRKVSIVINFQTGVVMVKGENFRHWIESEAQNVHSSLALTDDVPKPEESEPDDEVSKQIKSLWQDNEANKTSIESIDSSQRALREEIDQYLSAHGSAVEDVANLYSELKKSDNKLATFMETTTDACKKMLETEFAKINKKIDKIQDRFAELKTQVTDRIDKFIEKHAMVNENVVHIRSLAADIESQKKEIKDVLEGYKSFHVGNAEVEVDKHQTSTRRKLSVLRQDFDAQKTELSSLLQDFKQDREDKDKYRTDMHNSMKSSQQLLQTKIKELEDTMEELNKGRNTDNTADTAKENIEKKIQELVANNMQNYHNIPQSSKWRAELANLGTNTRRNLYEGRDIDVIFCMDSNSKYIRFKKLWTMKNTVRRRCYTQQGLSQFISELGPASLKYFLINVGVNDIDRMSGNDVYAEIVKNIDALKEKFPNIKIILAELTPRKDDKDAEVDICNKLINELAQLDENVFVASHDTLRGDKNKFLADNKHISRKTIGVFVVNLKRALCQAHGIPYLTRAEHEAKRRSGESSHMANE